MKKLLFLLLLPCGAFAQSPWTLGKCIEYAQQNNIPVRRAAIATDAAQVSLSSARLSRLPSVGASVGSNMSFGRSLGLDNTYSSTSQLSGSLSASASLPVFQGGQINQTIAAEKLSLQASILDLERARESVAVNILSLFLDALYNKELLGVAERQVALSTEQVVRAREQVAAGKSAASLRYETEASLSADSLSLISSQNTLSLSLLSLSQALNLPATANFDITAPTDFALPQMLQSVEYLYDYALHNRPGPRAEVVRLERANRLVKRAQAGYWPSITLTSGWGTNLYKSFADGAVALPFGQQFKNNASEYIGLSVNIPIFNRLSVRHGVRQARLSASTQELSVLESEQNLRKEIESAYQLAQNSILRYAAATSALRSAAVAFDYEREKFAAGRSTTFDYDSARVRALKAESEQLRAKYEYLFRVKLLDFYAGQAIVL